VLYAYINLLTKRNEFIWCPLVWVETTLST